MRESVKALARGLAFVAAAPSLISYFIRSPLIGRDRSLEGSTQMLSLIPGLAGEYIRRAFLSVAIAQCAPSAVVCFGTIFSKSGARLDDDVYIGPRCHLGLVHIERNALLAAGVHVTSGRRTHGTADSTVPIRNQPRETTMVRIGAGAWIGSAAVVMADVGADTVIGAGAVVTSPIPDSVVAAGVPARVIRSRVPPAIQPEGVSSS
jgi:acetyltransferase-like isoleucine patch superfamily enzyme